jgi:Na+:H+ antiporter, NhaA family
MAEHRLDRPVDENYDHVLGPASAQITLVEYGSYAPIAEPPTRSSPQYVTDSSSACATYSGIDLSPTTISRAAPAELAELAGRKQFWKAHLELMTRSETLNEGDLGAVAENIGLPLKSWETRADAIARARIRVDADERSATASGVKLTPTFLVNGIRWDASSLSDAMLRTLGHRVRSAALNFRQLGTIRRCAAAARNSVGHHHHKLAIETGIRSILATGPRLFPWRNQFPRVTAALG